MPPIHHWQFTFPVKSGIARDAVMWNLVTDNESGAFLSAFNSFMSTISTYLSPTLAGTGTYNQYLIDGHLNGSAAGPPVASGTVSPFTMGSTQLASQLAIAVSYHADDSSIPEHSPGARPRSRYRGRLFVGPVAASTQAGSSPNMSPTINHTALTIIGDAFAAIIATGFLGVWSRKDASVRVATHGWVDDAYDVQRRRKQDPTFRYSF